MKTKLLFIIILSILLSNCRTDNIHIQREISKELKYVLHAPVIRFIGFKQIWKALIFNMDKNETNPEKIIVRYDIQRTINNIFWEKNHGFFKDEKVVFKDFISHSMFSIKLLESNPDNEVWELI